MYSKSHGVISLLVGLALVAVGVTVVHPFVTVVWATAVGIAIDADHFLWARYNTGDWAALRYLLANPVAAVTDQSTIFDPDDLTALQRLLSHVAISGVVVPAVWLVSPAAGLTAGLALYAHVLADLVADVRYEQPVAGGPTS